VLQLFKGRATDDTIDLISRMLTYEPAKRITAQQCLAHPFFDELRNPDTRLPSGEPLPALFNFTEEELRGCSEDVREVIVPRHARTPANWKHGAAAAGSGTATGRSSAAGASSGRTAGGAPAAVLTGSGSSSRDSRSVDVTLPSPTAAALAAAAGGGGPAASSSAAAAPPPTSRPTDSAAAAGSGGSFAASTRGSAAVHASSRT